jgi:VWFA-related protein
MRSSAPSDPRKWLAILLPRIPVWVALCAGALLVSLFSAWGQAPPGIKSPSTSAEDESQPQSSKKSPAPPEEGRPVVPLEVTTRLVEVNVIVNDKHGNPVTGLKKEDFVLLDNKIPQEIQVFSVETNLPTAPPSAPAAPDTYSNQLRQNATPANVTLILLDALNTEFADQALTRKQVLRFLEQLRPQDRVALYWLGNNLYVLNDFTSDVASLREALGHSKGETNRDLQESNVDYMSTNSPNRSLPQGVPAGQTSSRGALRLAFDQRVANESTKNRVRLTTAALIAIAHHLGSLRGRKNLVWVSGIFPLSLGQEKFDLNWTNDTGGGSFSGEIARAAEALTDAGVAVYPVDARGLMGSSLTAAGDYSDAPPPEFSGEGNEHLPSRVTPGNLETMNTLAERTGGKAFYGSNNLAEAIRRAMDDSRATYTLGFYPAGVKWDGAFHRIKVKVKTRAAEVRARTGYFALPDSAKTLPESLETIVSQTAISQLDATAIGLRVHIQPASSSTEQALNVDLHLDLQDIHMKENNGVWTTTLQTIFLQLDNRGEIIQDLDEMLQVTLPPAAYALAWREGLKNTRHVPILPGASRLAIFLRDPSNDNLGSLSISILKYLPSSASRPASR